MCITFTQLDLSRRRDYWHYGRDALEIKHQ